MLPLITIDWTALGAIVGVAALALTIGAGVSRTILGAIRERQRRKRVEQKHQDDQRHIRQALIGYPATEFEPSRPGVIEVTRQLQDGAERLTIRLGDLEQQFHDHVTEREAHRRNGGSQ